MGAFSLQSNSGGRLCPRNEDRQHGQRCGGGKHHTAQHDRGELGWFSRACPDHCHRQDAHERRQPKEKDISKFRLGSFETCTSKVAVQPVGFGDPGGNQVRLHDSQRTNKAEKPTAAPRSARMPRRKRASTPPPIASGTTVIAKATRCHIMNPQKRTRRCCLPTTDRGTTQPTFWPTRFRIVIRIVVSRFTP